MHFILIVHLNSGHTPWLAPEASVLENTHTDSGNGMDAESDSRMTFQALTFDTLNLDESC